METYVVGKMNRERAEQGNLDGLIERLTPEGYQFDRETDGVTFSKVGRIEAVITEMVPVCEEHGLDVEDFKMTEYRKNDHTERSSYEHGKINRD